MRSNAVVKVPLRAQSVFLFLIKSFVGRPQKHSGHLLCFNDTLVCHLGMQMAPSTPGNPAMEQVVVGWH